MDPHALFKIVNALALGGWIALLASPLAPRWIDRMCAVLIPGLLAIAYTGLILGNWSRAEGGFGTLDDVMRLFTHPHVALAGWIHYLAYDLLVGAWIVRTARAEGVPFGHALPCLPLAFLFGPIGYLAFQTLRLSRAAPERPWWLARWWRRDPLYAGATIVLLALIPPTLAAMALDDRTVLGVDSWIKPLKFELSLALYLGTLAWFSAWMPQATRRSIAYRGFAMVVVASIAAEMAWIGGAAALGVQSHFNTGTPLMGTLYGLMGILAVTLTAGALVQGVSILRHREGPLSPAMRLAVGWSLILTFVLTVVVAGHMASRAGHGVGGASDDSGGLAFLGWSREGGDLRVAHFLATHAMHVVPLVVFMAAGLVPATRARLVALGTAGAYAGLVLLAFAQALSGRPLM